MWSLVSQTLFSGLLALRENKTSGEWQRQKLCVGDSQVCPGASTPPPFVLAFGQDDGGEVYLLGTSIPSYAPGVPATGVIYQITDPARYILQTLHTHTIKLLPQGKGRKVLNYESGHSGDVNTLVCVYSAYPATNIFRRDYNNYYNT